LTRTGSLAALLLVVQAGLLAYGALIHSPTFDETAHLPAGLAYWKLGREDVYPHNPPLVRAISALPLLAVGAETDWDALETPAVNRPEFALGREFIAVNRERAFWLYTLARWACLPFALLGGYVCYRWSSELYGPWAGLLSVWLWCFCPNVLGSGQWIAPDMGATALGLSACYLFWRWLGAPSWRRALAAGAVLGLAELTKFTWVILFGLWPLIWLLARSPARARLGQLAVILALGLYVLNLGYLFRGTLRPLASQDYFSRALGGPLANPADPDKGADNRFRNSPLGRLPVPLPGAYLAGIDLQKLDFERGFRSYLRGEWRKGGWWYYYLYGLGIKIPLGTLALLAWASLAGRQGLGGPADKSTTSATPTPGLPGESGRDLLCLLAPPLVIVALVSSQTGFSHHLRYVLPAFPFGLIFIGRLLPRDALRRRRMLVGLAACGTALGSLSVYPHSASFFNRLVGGPSRGAEHLIDSNISWGQDLLLLRRWLERRGPAPRPLFLAYFGNLDPRVAGIEFVSPPLGPAFAAGPLPAVANRQPDVDLGPRPGLYVVDVNLLHGMEQLMPDGRGGWVMPKAGLTDLSYFTDFKPCDRIGYSLYVYDLSVEDVNRVRRARRLQAWPEPPNR
jgi:4-amino-4-deoxy-L-arabinose transferase-like glycosyltransferase